MEANLSVRNRTLLRTLLSRSFATFDEAATEICRVARTALDADLAYASQLDGDEAEILAVDGVLASGPRPGMRFPLEQTFCRRALEGSGPQSASDLSVGPYADLPWPRALGVRAYAMSPLWDSEGRAKGTLSVLGRRSRSFTEGELALLELLGGLLVREQEMSRARTREAARLAEMQASDRRYRTLVDDLGDIIVEIEADGRIAYVNPAWVELTGICMEQMVGRDMMEQVHPDDRATAAAHMVEVLSGADTAKVEAAREVRFIAADGSIRWMSVRGRAVFDQNAQLTGFVGILHDVTTRVEAEQQVRAALTEAEAARDEAQAASAAKSEFLSRMSHELRTPLNAILGFGQLLELGELGGEDAENVEQILRAGRHLLDLINEVLDVVRVESGALSLSLETVEVGPVLAESLDLVRTAAAARNVGLRRTEAAAAAVVTADRQRLKQILVNLLSNAVKYNVDGGEVEVTTAPAPEEPGAEADVRSPHGWLRISVRDTGRGIAADRLADVFTPFDRLGAEATDIEGSGVGLSLTKTLVEALGGRIGLSSEVGRGSTFWFDLPAAAPLAPEEAAPDADAELLRTVLYVEDNPANVMLVRRVLARRPHVRLIVEQDGAAAVETARRVLPDLVLLDLHLPGMHGSGILTALRASDDARLAKIPVVVVTADLTVGNERRMLDAGATFFLPKPIDVRQLLAVVDEHLPLT